MDKWKEDLTIAPQAIHDSLTLVLESDGVVVAFAILVLLARDKPYVSSVLRPGLYLDYLFVSPEHIGEGCGSLLWNVSTRAAGRLGFDHLWIFSDPNARRFYEKRGAQFSFEAATPVPGLLSPVLSYSVRAGQGDMGVNVTIVRNDESESPDEHWFSVFYNGCPAGELGCHRFNPGDRTGELEVRIDSDHPGETIGTRAVGQFLFYYFFKADGETIMRVTERGDVDAVGLLTSLGFENAGATDQTIRFELRRTEYVARLDESIRTP